MWWNRLHGTCLIQELSESDYQLHAFHDKVNSWRYGCLGTGSCWLYELLASDHAMSAAVSSQLAMLEHSNLFTCHSYLERDTI